MKTISQFGPVVSFQETTLNALFGYEDRLVTMSAAGKIALSAGTAGEKVVGVYTGRLQSGSPECAVHLLNGGGIVRVKQGAAIAGGTYLMSAANGKVVAADGTSPIVGIKVGTGANGADNDIIGMLPVLPGLVHQTFPALGNSNGEISGLTISHTYSQAEIQALQTKAEELADDVRALRTSLIAAGVGVSA